MNNNPEKRQQELDRRTATKGLMELVEKDIILNFPASAIELPFIEGDTYGEEHTIVVGNPRQEISEVKYKTFYDDEKPQRALTIVSYDTDRYCGERNCFTRKLSLCIDKDMRAWIFLHADVEFHQLATSEEIYFFHSLLENAQPLTSQLLRRERRLHSQAQMLEAIFASSQTNRQGRLGRLAAKFTKRRNS